MSEPGETVAASHKPAEVVIVRLEYGSVREDGRLPSGGFIEVNGVCRAGAVEDGSSVDARESGIAHWALFLFPRDSHGAVTGWFMLFPDQCVFVDALPGMCLQEALVLH